MGSEMAKIALYLMTEKGLEVFERILSVDPSLVSHVVVGRDANLEKDHGDDIEARCATARIRCFAREKAPSVDENTFVMAVSWRWMIVHPGQRLIIFHDSLLPKYRGFSPLVNMLINGESRIGVSAVFGAQDYDRGDIIAQRHSEIAYPIKIADAIQINNRNYAELAEEIVRQISSSQPLVGQPQNEAEASYSVWRDREDYFVDWRQSASDIKRMIDAVGSPYAGARSMTSTGEEVVIEEAVEVADVACELRHPGKVLFVEDGRPTVLCGTGLLRIEKASLVTPDGQMDFLPVRKFRIRFR
ncbi:methionyl-tRNA formyltransferase [Labrenzia sp. VG12]|nr:methionyl-tRNA formyltransferase [Labrenzia sp. VG12]